MALKPEVSLPVAAATAGLVYALYTNATPPVADIRVAPADNPDIDSSRKMAAWTATAVVCGVSLIAKDPTIFVIGGASIIAMDWWTRHANAVKPETGKASSGTVVDSVAVSTGYYDDSDGTAQYMAE